MTVSDEEGDPPEHGVLLASGLVCPAASEAIALEQAARLDGVHCLIVTTEGEDR
jgi:hypothetical protein